MVLWQSARIAGALIFIGRAKESGLTLRWRPQIRKGKAAIAP
jgi:hypothetical protein